MSAAIRRLRWAVPYLFLLPGGLWLLVFFVVPMAVMASISLQTGSLGTGYTLSWNFGIYPEAISQFATQFLRSFEYGFIVTVLTLLIGYPMAYFLARRAGRYKTVFLALFLAPFWISYMLRLLAWRSLLADDGYVNRILMGVHLIGSPYPFLQGKPLTLILGLVYGYVPYMILPLYATLDRIPASLIEAGRDLGLSPARTFWRVTLPQSYQAILAGLVICILPMFGDYFTQQLLADRASTRMVGNAIVDALTQPIFVQRGAALILVMLVLLIPPILYYLRSTRRATELVR